MLRFLIVLYALCGVQGKAFPNRYKRDYEASYHYIPYEESVVRIPAGYSPENYPSYQDYIHGYVQMNSHNWPVYYNPPVPSRPVQDPSSNVNGQHKIKADHTWHFTDRHYAPEAEYKDARLQLKSDVEVGNVIDVQVKKGVEDKHNAPYGDPFVEDLSAGKPVKAETIASYTLDDLNEMYSPDNKKAAFKPVSYNVPIKEKPIKEKPIKEKPIKEKPIKEKPIKEKPIKEKPIKEKPIKEPIVDYNEYERSFGLNSLKEVDHDLEAPIVIEAIVSKEKPVQKEGEYKMPLMEEHEAPVVVEALIRKEKPDHHMEGEYENPMVNEHEAPVVVEALIRKEPAAYMEGQYEMPMVNEHEAPVVVEALIRKEKPAVHINGQYEMSVVESLFPKRPVYEKTNTKENKVHSKDKSQSGKEYILTKEDVKNFDIPAVEVLSFEQDIDSTETSFEEMRNFNEEDIDGFEETGGLGSGMDSEGLDFARNFIPVNSNIFSMVTDIKKQERRKFKSCVTPKNETGNCMPFQLCSVSSAVSNVEELLRNVCVIDEVFLGVCCPEFPVQTVLVNWEQLQPDTNMLNEDKSEVSKECGKLPPMVTDQDPWPWMALLIAKYSGKIFCGGALVSEQYVLTAAHCTVRIPRNQILVRLGRPSNESSSDPDLQVVEIKRHAGYNPRTMQNDIALLKLSRRVRFDDFRRVVCLAKDEEGMESLVREPANLLRWKETPGEIKDVESLSVISGQECQSRIRNAIADSIICTEPRTEETMCNADSGAPLILEKDGKFSVIGILTWNRNDCDERFPTIFTRVSSYHRWIEKLAS